MTVNFMLTWLGHRISSIILGVSVRVFWDEINIRIGRSSQQIAVHNAGGPHPISEGWTEQKV